MDSLYKAGIIWFNQALHLLEWCIPY